jgi:hypothetical protein
VRRLAIVAIAVAGVGLFGSGVRGLVQIDGVLADSANRPAAHKVKRELGGRDDCPRLERPSPERRRKL